MQMLKEQISKGNNGLVKRKFITFGIEADNLKAAKQKLERIEADIKGNFKILGVAVKSLDGLERLELLHASFNEGSKEKFGFNWDLVYKTGLSSKDLSLLPLLILGIVKPLNAVIHSAECHLFKYSPPN